LGELNDLREKNKELKAALAGIQWGSCDNCGIAIFCPECGGQSFKVMDEEEAELNKEYRETFGHYSDCKVGLALKGLK
jgi:hypothetical protein